jgi:histone acetyltransferase (RNA polymerase elongator complex component)
LVLERLAKGVTPEEVASAGRRAKEFGFEVSFYVLSGAGGADRWREHARESARVCSDAGPDFIRLRTLTILRGTPLFELEEKGEFGITEPLASTARIRQTGTVDTPRAGKYNQVA